jgi:hypothetical protein
VGRAQAQLVSEQSAPVVRDLADLVEFERVQERDDVGEQLLAGVSGRRCVGPAGAAQIRADHPVMRGQPGEDPAPLPPVLGEAVE